MQRCIDNHAAYSRDPFAYLQEQVTYIIASETWVVLGVSSLVIPVKKGEVV